MGLKIENVVLMSLLRCREVSLQTILNHLFSSPKGNPGFQDNGLSGDVTPPDGMGDHFPILLRLRR
jgi:hypothetical protein